MSEVATIALGKWPHILAALGINDEHLANRHGPCPMCGGRDRFRFDDKDGKGTYYCNGCGAGDGLDLLMKFHGWDFKTAASEVERIAGDYKPLPQKKQTDPRIRLRKIRDNAKALTGNDPASRYLAGRGIKDAPGLLYSEAEPYFEDGKLIATYPAMLGLVQSPDGKPATWHVTYLSDEGKAPVSAPKKVMKSVGGISGAAIRLFAPGRYMGVAEGIETAIAAQMMTGIPTWAVLNTTGMQGFVIPEKVEELTIFGDNDMNFAGQLAAYHLANRLALKKTTRVNVWIPEEPGTDWLDVMQSGNYGTVSSRNGQASPICSSR